MRPQKIQGTKQSGQEKKRNKEQRQKKNGGEKPFDILAHQNILCLREKLVKKSASDSL